MTVVCTVQIPLDLAQVEKVEADNPEVMEQIMAAAGKYMAGHRRLATDGKVLDVDQYASRQDYEAFIAQAGPAIARYGELLGAPAQDTLYELVHEMAPNA